MDILFLDKILLNDKKYIVDDNLTCDDTEGSINTAANLHAFISSLFKCMDAKWPWLVSQVAPVSLTNPSALPGTYKLILNVKKS